ATNQFLEDEIEAGRFRDDLYYRLNVVPIFLPPLRERRKDIPLLAEFFLGRYCEENRRDTPKLMGDVLEALTQYDWPGNVRELENHIERAVVLAEGELVNLEVLIHPGRGERRLRPAKQRGANLEALIQNLVRTGIQSVPPEEGNLYHRLVR